MVLISVMQELSYVGWSVFKSSRNLTLFLTFGLHDIKFSVYIYFTCIEDSQSCCV